MGLLDITPDQWGALGLLGAGGMRGDWSGGFLAAGQHLGSAQERAMKQKLIEAQIAETLAQGDERKAKVAAAQREAAMMQQIPSLFRSGGMSGGEPVPQTMGGVPMFSQPMGAAPMRQEPGGFDVQGALRLGLKPEQIAAYAGLTNVGRPKVARTIEVDDGRGGKETVQLDEFGQRVGGGMPGYIPPVQVNRGDRVEFVRPQPGVSLGINMSPEGRDASARGWESLKETKRHNSVSEGAANAGRAPQGYRFKPDGSLEAIPGGPADKQSAATADERKAATLLQRLEGSQSQLQSALAKSPGAAKPELLPESIRGARLPVIGGLPGAEPLANKLTSEKRQQVEAAQLDMLDAALTLGTGAAYTREQLESYRKSYFPQVGDDPQTVLDKQARLQNVIQAARIAAGRAANVTGVKPQSGGAGGSWDSNNDPLGLRRP